MKLCVVLGIQLYWQGVMSLLHRMSFFEKFLIISINMYGCMKKKINFTEATAMKSIHYSDMSDGVRN